MTSFDTLGLHDKVLKAVAHAGYDTPSPIQAQAIPSLLCGRDLLGIAQTGTGKTAAFTLPTIDKMLRTPRKKSLKSVRVLVLAPTRELALQINKSFRTYGRPARTWVEVAVGGVKIGPQIRALKSGTDVLVATPGRLVDLMSQNAVHFDDLDTLILDEADHMLDLGFARDLRKIVAAVPDQRQTMLFSATMPKTIAHLAQDYLFDPVTVSVTPESTTAERVRQGVLHVNKPSKPAVLAALLKDPSIDKVLVFARTKHGADAVVRQLSKAKIEAKAIHGNKSQAQRVRALEAFRSGDCPVLVATDIAARGIDVPGVTHVVNYEMPNVPEQYVHRIGRTARAGREGVAVSLVAEDELYYLRDIEKVTRTQISVLDAPEGLGDRLYPTPDRNTRPPKPKGPVRGGRPAQQRAKPAQQARQAQQPTAGPRKKVRKNKGKRRQAAA
ncbi:MAG: DEAD/DEAH box helicase [Pseudomonadota bacterium]